MKWLTLDCSSTSIGWALFSERGLTWSGTHYLKGNILQRVDEAERFVSEMLRQRPVDIVLVEAPVNGKFNAIVAQARVMGVVMLACSRARVQWSDDITPAAGKKALTGKGKAEKKEMVERAVELMGTPLDQVLVYQRTKSGPWIAELGGDTICDEHQADAIGIGLAFSPPSEVPI